MSCPVLEVNLPAFLIGTSKKLSTILTNYGLYVPDVNAAGEEDGEHHGPREQGGGREVPTPSRQGAHSFHFHRSQGRSYPLVFSCADLKVGVSLQPLVLQILK
jgi:hypothetical protein